jgi:lambda family phage minor tail protein L
VGGTAAACLFGATGGAIDVQLFGAQMEVGSEATDYMSNGSVVNRNPTADPTAEFPRDVYYVDRKSGETSELVEFELAASLDLAGVALPRRQIIQNYCPWLYRGAECGYTGTNYFDTNDSPVGSLSLDVCGKRLSSCRARFGQTAELPYGGFPGAGLLKV